MSAIESTCRVLASTPTADLAAFLAWNNNWAMPTSLKVWVAINAAIVIGCLLFVVGYAAYAVYCWLGSRPRKPALPTAKVVER